MWTINVVVLDRRGKQRQIVRSIRMAQADTALVVNIRSQDGRWQLASNECNGADKKQKVRCVEERRLTERWAERAQRNVDILLHQRGYIGEICLITLDVFL